ncbi:MAG: PTS sugar transporter subunit IIA [Desulfamplus sp.]|nr:PTS sugar transporter subunit IIA [Desulfamplus sp.]MBF0241986.1 PTS sugar transporter subunit IIA [Desulfamplus sp.]
MRRALTEIANDLGLNLDTLDRWIRQGKIPVSRQGSIGIYSESDLNRWSEKHRKHQSLEDTIDSKKVGGVSELILLSALKRGGIFHNIAGNSKDEVIAAAVDTIPDFPQKDRDQIYLQLIERESLASTGIGKGVAIPHPRNPIARSITEPMITTCFLQNSIDFDAIDGRAVSVLFVLLSPSVESHLNLLSRLSFCLRDANFIEFIHQKPDADLLLQRVQDVESSIDNKEM